jgi:hypothetical protein
VKDRVALKSKLKFLCHLVFYTNVAQVINDAEQQGHIFPNTNSMIFEGTVGSTGISIATVAKAR